MVSYEKPAEKVGLLYHSLLLALSSLSITFTTGSEMPVKLLTGTHSASECVQSPTLASRLVVEM